MSWATIIESNHGSCRLTSWWVSEIWLPSCTSPSQQHNRNFTPTPLRWFYGQWIPSEHVSVNHSTQICHNSSFLLSKLNSRQAIHLFSFAWDRFASSVCFSVFPGILLYCVSNDGMLIRNWLITSWCEDTTNVNGWRTGLLVRGSYLDTDGRAYPHILTFTGSL